MNVFELYGSLGLKTSDFKKGLTEAQKNAKNASNNIQGSFNNLNDSLNVLVDAMNHGIDNAVSGSFGSFSNAAGIGISVIENVILAIKKADNFITTVNDTVVKTTANIITSSFDFAKAIDENVMGAVDSARDVVVEAFGQMMNAGLEFLQSVTEEGMSFDTAMGQVSATLLRTREDFDNEIVSVNGFTGSLRDLAKELGASTKFTATQAGEGLNYMALAGYNAQKSAKMLPKVLDLAAAGAMDLGTASDMVTDAQTALGISMKDMTAFIDQMAKTASSSNTSVLQLGDALLAIGATGRMIKKNGATDYNELITALGVLANNGIKASEGGNDLRRILTRLTSPTKDAKIWFDRFGFSMYDSKGEMKDFSDNIIELSQSLNQLTDQERTQAVTDIFGQYALAGANALLNTSAKRWEELGAKIKDSEGAAKEMADIQLDTLPGQITILESAISGLKIELYDRLSPVLKDFVEQLSEGLTSVTEEISSGNFEAAFIRLGNRAVKFIETGVDEIMNGDEVILTFTTGLTTVLSKVGGALFNGGVEVIPMLLGHLLRFSTDIISRFSEFISSSENLLLLQRTISDIFEQFGTFFSDNRDDLYIIFSTLLDLAVGVIGDVFVLQRETVYSVLWEKFTDILDDLVVNLGGFLESDETQTIVDNVISLIGSVTQKLTDSAPVILPDLLDFVLEIADKVITGVADYIADEENVDKIRGTLRLLLAKIEAFLEEHSEDFYQIVSTLWDVGIGFVWEIWELRRKTVAETLGRKLKEVLDDCFDGDNPFALSLPSVGYNILSGIIDGMNADDPSIVGTIGNIADRILALFKGFLEIESPSKVMKREVGRYLALGIGEGMTEEMESVSQDMADAIPTSFDISPELVGGSTRAENDYAYGGIYMPINIEKFYANSEQDVKAFAKTLSVELRTQILRKNAAVAYA